MASTMVWEFGTGERLRATRDDPSEWAHAQIDAVIAPMRSFGGHAGRA